MSGRAIILIVAGIIIVSGVILYRIEAASTNIVSNSVGQYKKQATHNMAQSGVNLALRQLGNSRTWRTGFNSLDMLGGNVTVTLFDTSFMGITSAIGIRSSGSVSGTTSTSTAFCYFPASMMPIGEKGLLTLHAPNQVSGSITIDGRDHDLSGNLVPGSGTFGVWTTGASFTIGGSAQVGGTTSSNVDKAPSGILDTSIIRLNQVFPPPGFPNTPDSVFGGASYGYPEGTLKAIAQSGVGGSQYVTNPLLLTYPLSGVTYVEMPLGSPSWTGASVGGAGILVVHNSAKTAQLVNTQELFTGIMISDDIVNLHGNVLGAIVALTTNPGGNVLGNGSAVLRYSRSAIQSATSIFTNGTQLKVIAWWE